MRFEIVEEGVKVYDDGNLCLGIIERSIPIMFSSRKKYYPCNKEELRMIADYMEEME